MREAVKSYHMFFPRAWLKWCIYILYPLCMIGIIYVLSRYVTFFSYVCVGLACCMIVALEMMLDTYVFLGIASRNTNRLEYMKTSAKGLHLLKKALVADAVRRFLSTALILAGIYLVIKTDSMWNNQVMLLQCIACIMITDLLVELAFIFTRLFTNVWINLAAIYILGGVASMEGFIVLHKIPFLLIFLLIAVYAGMTAAGRMLILRRARESYHDERN